MKKILILLLSLVLLLSLCACGAKQAPEAPTDAPAAAPVEEAPVEEAPVEEAPVEETPVEEAPAEEAPAQEPEEDPVALARSYIDKPIEELLAVIGQPESSDYAPSCLGDGEDGMLFYDGFIVYTYKEGDVETVYDAE